VNDSNKDHKPSFDPKAALSGGLYIATLLLIAAFIIKSLSDFIAEF